MPSIRLWFGHQLDKQQFICTICDKSFDTINEYEDIGLDHIDPISRGGAKDLSNCHLVHQECNRIKGDFSLKEIKYLMAAVNPDAWEILKNRLKRSTLIFRGR